MMKPVVARTVDLNADVGEGLGRWRSSDDPRLLETVTSANIACGAHAGDPVIMRETCRLAVAGQVAIGAHVGYPDLIGFGRRAMDLGLDELAATVIVQVGGLDAAAQSVGGVVSYVKPHGALYHRLAHDVAAAIAVSRAVHALNAELAMLGLPGSAVERACAEQGVRFVAEAFADRRYTQGGGLVPREQAGSVLGPEAAARQAVSLALHHVAATDGEPVRVEAQSICVHGDAPDAGQVAGAVAGALRAAGVELRRFA